MKGVTLRTLLCLCTGFVFLLFGFVMIATRFEIYEYCKYYVLHMSPNSQMYKNWARNPFPLEFHFYVFNWTNPEALHDRNVKPHFVEMGPYKFDEIREKLNVKWNENNETLSFNVMKTWFYKENQTRRLDENVTVPNAVNIVGVETTRYKSFFTKRALSLILSTASPGVAVRRTIGDIIFEGYSDIVLTIGNIVNANNKRKIPKFAFFYGRNHSETYDGYFNIDVNYENTGRVLEWNRNRTAKGMRNECDSIESWSPDLFKHNFQRTDSMEFFVSDLCRPLLLDFEAEVAVNGLRGYKYVVGARMLDNGTNVAGNECYCNGDCLPSGIINVTSCKDGPMYASLPHFHQGDPFYAAQVTGVEANKERHEFYITLEPNTGIILEVAARVQVNVFMKPDPDIALYADVPQLMLPVLWFEQYFRLPEATAFQIRVLLELPKIVMAFGFANVLISCLITFFASRRIVRNGAEMERRSLEELKQAELTKLKNGAVRS